ncbi:MAG: hypothetical protein BGO41_03540 [Clostridiales bacterium 38-18]|nr:MAG: hypothetical protein BGO41_03540 [Clostridiales bacterium 38-18]
MLSVEKQIQLDSEIEQFIALTALILVHPKFKEMRQFIQHGTIDCLDHSISVAFHSYIIAKKLRLDYQSVARGALLHDFFLYDWHHPRASEGLHGFTHARKALENAEKYFTLSNTEREIILKHMWPLNPSLPRKREALVVIFVDKWISLKETLRIRESIAYAYIINQINSFIYLPVDFSNT